jgi:hypothetical protein
LNPGSHYDLKYFLNDNELPFADYSLTTLSAGSFNVGFGVINEEVNGGEVQIIWGNQSGMDVEGEWKFSGIDLDGNNRVLVQPITFTNGLINQASTELQNGFKQNSSLNVSIEINGVSFITTSFITNTIQYSDFQNLNINDPSTPVDLFPSEENINRTKVMVNASGEGQVRQVLFRLTDTNGLNLNNYPDNWSFDGSANFDLTFSETIPGSGIWEATLSITEDISAGSNTYLIGIGTENYTVSTPGMSDNFDLQVLLIDDDNKVVGDTANSIGLQFNE